MQTKKTSILVTIALLFSQLGSCQDGISQNSISSKLLSYSTMFDSLRIQNNETVNQMFNSIVREASIVCLGESRHDIHEQFLLKFQLIKALVKDHGFQTFILEASLPYAEQINAYIQNGEDDLQILMSNMPGASIWDNEEMASILQWMRSYNQNQREADKLCFKGIDIVAPEYGVHAIFNYLEDVDSEWFKTCMQIEFGLDQIEDSNWPQSLQNISQLTDRQQQVLIDNYSNMYMHIADNQDKYIRLSSESEYDRILRFAYCAREAINMFTADSNLEMGLIRESSMANNAIWAAKNGGLTDKSIIWAHNVHITKGEFYMTGYTERIKGMGYLLTQEFGGQMVSIGATYNRGEFVQEGRSFSHPEKQSFEGIVASLNCNFALIDLNSAKNDEGLSQWLDSQQTIRGQEFEMTFIPTESFDAIYYVDRISKVKDN